MNTRTVLIFLGVLAVILGIFAFFAVFGPPTGSYSISGNAGATDTFGNIASSTFAFATTTPATTTNPAASSFGGDFATTFPQPALTWQEGNSNISITALSLSGSDMTFTLSVQMGAAPECVPLNLRLVADEEGDLDPPNPASFSFSDSGNCNGAAGKTYTGETTDFTVDPTALPLLFTTGGTSNIFFEVATSSNNGLSVDFPGTSG